MKVGKLISIDNLGLGGLNLDIPNHDLPPEMWSNARNVRFADEVVSLARGFETVYQNGGANNCKTSPYALWQVFNTDNTPIWLYGGSDKVYATDGVTHKDISKGSFTYTTIDYSYRWTGGALNGVPILNNGNGTDPPQQWDRDYSTPGLLADLSNWPANTFARILRPHKSFLIAYNVRKNGTWYGDMVKWSSSAAVGTVPGSWSPTDTSEANEIQLSRTPGAILDAMDLGDLQLIYKQDAIYRMQYVGGSTIFKFWPLSLHSGLLNTHAVADVGNIHAFITSDMDIAISDGTQLQSIGNKRIWKWLQGEVDEEYVDRTVVRALPTLDEVWFAFPQAGSNGLLTMALVWEKTDSTFSLRELPGVSAFQFGNVPLDVDDRVWDTLLPNTVWDETEGTWNSKLDIASSRYFIFGENDSTTPRLLRGPSTFTAADGAAYIGYVERLGLAIAGEDRQRQPIVDWGITKQLISVRPKIRADSPVDVYVYAQMLKDGPVQIQGPFSYDPGTDFKVDCNITGRALGVRFESTKSFKLSGYGLDLRIRGRY